MAAKRGNLAGTVLLAVGGVASAATVQVNVHGGAAATLYTTETGSTTTTNPITTDSSGNFSVWVPEGDYDLVVSGTGVTGRTITVGVLQAANEPGPLSTATGDITYANAANTIARLAVGGSNTVLHGGTTPAYSQIAVADHSATGTPSASTFYRGDNTWATPVSTGTQLDRKTITADVTGITATTEGTAVAVITGNSISYDGTEVVVEFYAPGSINSGNDGVNTFVVLRDSTVIGQAFETESGGTAQAVYLQCFDTPSAGAHTYKVSMFVGSGTGSVKAGAGGSGNYLPAFLRVSKA